MRAEDFDGGASKLHEALVLHLQQQPRDDAPRQVRDAADLALRRVDDRRGGKEVMRMNMQGTSVRRFAETEPAAPVGRGGVDA